MPYHRDPNESSYPLEPEAVSPDRPPQLKETSCGFRCGWGCCEPSEEESDGDGGGIGSVTVVDSENSNDFSRVFSFQENLDGMGTSRPGDLPVPVESGSREGLVVAAGDSEERVVAWEGPFARLQRFQGYNELPESPGNAQPSGYQSRATSSSRHAGPLSPMSPGPGIGEWITQFPYYFHATPLRLSPQYEHCRGHPASHLVTQDNAFSLDFMWETGARPST